MTIINGGSLTRAFGRGFFFFFGLMQSACCGHSYTCGLVLKIVPGIASVSDLRQYVITMTQKAYI
jgi:hypothetical protein